MCTKNVHFEFNGETFQQLDGAAMGSPSIAGIFMVELENTLKEMNVVSNPAINNATEENAVEHKVFQCTLPYAGEKGEYIVKEVNKEFKKLKRHNLKTRFALKAKRLSSCSNLKDPIKKEHLHNVVNEIYSPPSPPGVVGPE